MHSVSEWIGANEYFNSTKPGYIIIGADSEQMVSSLWIGGIVSRSFVARVSFWLSFLEVITNHKQYSLAMFTLHIFNKSCLRNNISF